MPTTYIFEPSAITAPINNGPLRKEYPFQEQGDISTLIVTEPMSVWSKAYTPLADGTTAPADITSFATGSGTLYFLDDTDIVQEPNAPITKFNRNWGTVPTARTVNVGTAAYSYPAITLAGGATGSLSGSNGGSIFTSSMAHGLAVNDVLIMSTYWQINGTQVFVFRSDVRPVLSVIDTTKFSVSNILPGATLISGNYGKISLFRRARSIVAPSIEEYEYYAPNTSASSISIPQPFVVTDLGGQEVDEVNYSTIPNATQYSASIASGDYLVYDSEISRWRGGILQKIVRKVRYI